MNYKGYTLHISPTYTQFGCKVCFIKQGGLTIDKAIGDTEAVAMDNAQQLVDYIEKGFVQ